MPLNTQILENGKARKDIDWSTFFAVNCMYTVALKETDPDFVYTDDGAKVKNLGTIEFDGKTYEKYLDFSLVGVYYLKSKAPLINTGSQKVKENHIFIGPDGTELVIRAGNTLRAWRSYK